MTSIGGGRHERLGVRVTAQQRLDLEPQRLVPGTSGRQECWMLIGRPLERRVDDLGDFLPAVLSLTVRPW